MPRPFPFRKPLFIAALLMTTMISPAHAAIDQAGAEHLRAMFQRILDESAQDGALKLDGKVMVEMAENYYAVTLPHITSHTIDGSRMTIGMIAMNVSPTAKPDQWNATMALPTPITYYAPDGKVDTTAAIGQQNFAGLWDEKIENFSRVQAQYKNIVMQAADGSFVSSIADVTTTTDLKEGADGLWSGPATIKVAGAEVGADDGSLIRAGAITLETNIKGHAHDRAEKIRAIAQEAAKAPQAQQKNAFMSLLNNALGDGAAWDGFDSRNKITNLEIITPARKETPASTIKIAQISYDVAVDNLRQKTNNGHMLFDLQGLSTLSAPAHIQNLLPQNATIDVNLNNIPLKDMTAIIKTAQDSLASSNNTPAIKEKASADLKRLFAESGSELVLNDGAAINTLYDLKAKGRLQADAAAKNGLIGGANIVFAGIDDVLSALNQMGSANVTPEQKDSLRGMGAMLAVMQMIGKQGTSASGKSARLYDIEIKPDGQILLNGADINALMPQ